MMLALNIFVGCSIAAVPVALLLGRFIQNNRPADMHDEWVNLEIPHEMEDR